LAFFVVVGIASEKKFFRIGFVTPVARVKFLFRFGFGTPEANEIGPAQWRPPPRSAWIGMSKKLMVIPHFVGRFVEFISQYSKRQGS
jgi:hypothetical protein